MKKKHVNKTQPRPSAPRRTRREAQEAARLSAEEKERRALFHERMKNAPPRVRLKTVRTKGYYRFAKEYPSDVGADGYRENRPPARRLSAAGRCLLALLCVAVFCLAFIAVRAAMLVSAAPGETDYLATGSDAVPVVPGLRALRFSAEDLRGGDTQAMKRTLEQYGCNAAVFELKDPDGNVVFPTELALGAAGENVAETAWDTVAALEQADVRTVAYISCFRDSAATAYDTGLAVMDFDDPDEPLRDPADSLWLDPYRPETAAYLTGLISEAIDGGFSYVVLDNVCFPYDLGLKTAYFSAADVADRGENSILLDFLAQALGVSGTGQLIVMCDVNGLASGEMGRDNRYGGSLLHCGAENFAVDARLSLQPADEPDPLGLFAYKDDVPVAFILSACAEAYNAVKQAENMGAARVLACVENDGRPDAMKELLAHTGLNDYIIW